MKHIAFITFFLLSWGAQAQNLFSEQGIALSLPDRFEQIEPEGAAFASFRGSDGTWLSLANTCEAYLDVKSLDLDRNMELDLCFDMVSIKMHPQDKVDKVKSIKDTVINKLHVRWNQYLLNNASQRYMIYFLLLKGQYHAYELQFLAPPEKEAQNLKTLTGILHSYSEFDTAKRYKKIKYKDFRESFTTHFCQCTDRGKGRSATEIMYTTTAGCIRKFVLEQRLAINALIDKDKSIDEGLSKEERREVWERQLMADAIDDIIAKCVTYREAVIDLKKEMAEKSGADPQKAAEVIEKLQQQISAAEDKKEQAQYHAFIGLMYAYIGDKKQALKSFNTSIDIKPTTAAIAFRAVLQYE